MWAGEEGVECGVRGEELIVEVSGRGVWCKVHEKREYGFNKDRGEEKVLWE